MATITCVRVCVCVFLVVERVARGLRGWARVVRVVKVARAVSVTKVMRVARVATRRLIEWFRLPWLLAW